MPSCCWGPWPTPPKRERYLPVQRLDDPKGQPIERVRAIRDDIRARVEALIVQEGARQPDSYRSGPLQDRAIQEGRSPNRASRANSSQLARSRNLLKRLDLPGKIKDGREADRRLANPYIKRPHG